MLFREKRPIFTLLKRTLSVALICLAACSGGHRETRPLVLVGIDGADWHVIDALIDRGELPNFRFLKNNGTWGPLINPGPQVSPVVWTTFATGHFGRDHGVLDFVYPYVEGPKRPVESVMRREPAIWNLATHYGMRSTVIGYFVSYPADVIDGVMVTDRVMQDLDGSVYPDSLRGHVDAAAKQVKSRKGRRSVLKRFFPWGYAPAQAEDLESPYLEAARLVIGRLDHAFVKDELLRRLTLELLEEPTDLFITYFRLVDYAGHSLWWYWDDSDFENPPKSSDKELLGEVIPETYRFMDELLGAVLENSADAANIAPNIVIVSDHGMASGTGLFAPRKERFGSLTGNHRPDGVFLAYGPDIQPGRIDGVTIMEVMPTLANLLGIPISNDLPGDIDERVLTESFRQAHPARYVSDYRDVEWASSDRKDLSQAAQEEAMDALQGLGYIGGDVELEEQDALEPYDFWGADSSVIVPHLSGEVSFYLLRGRLDVALAIHKEAIAHDPRLGRKLRIHVRSRQETLVDRLGEDYFRGVPFQAWMEETGKGGPDWND